jgi:hypothetical protein
VKVVIAFGQQVGHGGTGQLRRRNSELLGGLAKLFGLRRWQVERYVHAFNLQPGAPYNKPLQPTSDAGALRQFGAIVSAARG